MPGNSIRIFTRFSLTPAMLAAFAFATAAAFAEPPKEDAAQNPAGQQNAQPAQPPAADPHAGHNHGPQPQPQGHNPQAVRPPDVPAPTVVNKPGEIPKIKFDTPIYDFGKIRAGEDIRKDFWFTNEGNGTLEILKVRPACGCTTAGEHDKIVEPGKTGKIPLKVGTTNFSGPITKTITIVTNCEGTDANITLQIKGEVWQVVQVSPNNASFGRVTAESAADGSLVRKLTIVNNTEKDAKFEVASSSNPAFKAELREIEPGKKAELSVTLAGSLSTGMTSGNVEVTTGLAEMAKVSVPVNAFLTADVDVTPNRLTLPTGRTTPLQRHFYVRNNGTKALKISDIEVSNPALKTTISETQPGIQYRITLDIPPEYQVAEKGDTLSFKTDSTTVPSLTIPITEMNYGGNPAMQAIKSATPAPGAMAQPAPGTPDMPAGNAATKN